MTEILEAFSRVIFTKNIKNNTHLHFITEFSNLISVKLRYALV